MEFFTKILETIINLWKRGKALLWALAGICAVIFGVFMATALLGVSDADAKLRSYGLVLIAGAAVFGALALVRTLLDRKRPTLHLIADERQSWWEQYRFPDGRVTTQLCFRLEATNLTNTPIRLSAARLTRPRTWARVIKNDVITRSPDYPQDNRYSRENSIFPSGTAKVMSIIIFERGIGGPGDRLKTTLRLSDQFGRWHKLKFALSARLGSR